MVSAGTGFQDISHFHRYCYQLKKESILEELETSWRKEKKYIEKKN